ncbi:MAG: GGDEF domain-containing protein [Deltaproteobacteria bacterium]|nr:GGDEF domain-containing protein [Deltaproteobacteria bacterium]
MPTTARWLPSMKWVLGEGADLPVAAGDPVLVHPIQLGRDPLGAIVLARGDLDGEGVVHGVRTCCEAAALLVHQFRLREAVARDAMYDGLTALYNRPAFMKQLAGSIAFCRRYKAALALLMVDADHFKRVNDEHGHLAGDVALRFISDTVRRALREYDFAGRYGGEEIAVALPHTDADGAVTVAERIRALVEAATVPAGSARLRLTVSIGVGALTGTMRACEDLIAVADAALYAAKDGGRNRVVVG